MLFRHNVGYRSISIIYHSGLSENDTYLFFFKQTPHMQRNKSSAVQFLVIRDLPWRTAGSLMILEGWTYLLTSLGLVEITVYKPNVSGWSATMLYFVAVCISFLHVFCAFLWDVLLTVCSQQKSDYAIYTMSALTGLPARASILLIWRLESSPRIPVCTLPRQWLYYNGNDV